MLHQNPDCIRAVLLNVAQLLKEKQLDRAVKMLQVTSHCQCHSRVCVASMFDRIGRVLKFVSESTADSFIKFTGKGK